MHAFLLARNFFLYNHALGGSVHLRDSCARPIALLIALQVDHVISLYLYSIIFYSKTAIMCVDASRIVGDSLEAALSS